jgi:hypothetical protein
MVGDEVLDLVFERSGRPTVYDLAGLGIGAELSGLPVVGQSRLDARALSLPFICFCICFCLWGRFRNVSLCAMLLDPLGRCV